MDPEEEVVLLRKQVDLYRMVLVDVCAFLERICSPTNHVLRRVRKVLGYSE